MHYPIKTHKSFNNCFGYNTNSKLTRILNKSNGKNLKKKKRRELKIDESLVKELKHSIMLVNGLTLLFL